MQAAREVGETAAMLTVTPEWLLAQAEIEPGGVVEWGCSIPEHEAGIYIVTTSDPPIAGQPVIYIGRAKCLSRRLKQFYSHKYGDKAPHRGGQEILKLDGLKMVHWAPSAAYAEAERRLLEAFRSEAGAWPYGNRMKSARMALYPS